MGKERQKMKQIIEFRNITKYFPGVVALRSVNFSIEGGSIHALVGENGAGKSTLMNILGGEFVPDSGTVCLNGIPVCIKNPAESLRLGIGIVHQELNLCPNLTITENIYLGREKDKSGKVCWQELDKKSAALLKRLGVDFDPKTKIRNLSLAAQQLIEIARAISYDAEILIMDEPTSALTINESEKLFGIIQSLKEAGKTIIYISHRMEEVFRISDKISILRDGEYLGTYARGEITHDKIIKLIAGKELSSEIVERKKESRTYKEPVLQVKNLCRPGFFNGLDFNLYPQEILGIYGLQGAGRTELLETLFGLAPSWSGEIWLNGKQLKNRNPADAIRNGFAMVPENRLRNGIFSKMSITENMNCCSGIPICRAGGLLNMKKMVRNCSDAADKFSIKIACQNEKIKNLSGGNQQKVVIAKWIAASPDILMIDEPTRGIDVGAKAQIYRILRKLSSEGLSVIMVSSELSEVLSQCDRILVMKGGCFVSELTGNNATKEKIIAAAI